MNLKVIWNFSDLLKSIKTQVLKGCNNSVFLFLKDYLVEDKKLIGGTEKTTKKT